MIDFLHSSWNASLNRLKRLRIGSSYWALYGLLTDPQSICLLFVATICAIAAGVPFPLLAVVFRGIIEDFPPTEDEVQVAIRYILAIASAYFALTWTWTVCWGVVGGRISRRLQEALVEKIVGFDMAYFDTEPLDLTSILTADVQTIQRGTSEKVGLFIQSISYFVATFITGFILSPALTGVLLAAILPTMLILIVVGSSMVSSYSKAASKLSEEAGSLAEQVLRAVHVVQAFSAVEVLCGKHSKSLQHASFFAFRKSITSAIMLGLVYFVCYAVNALAFYWGSKIGGSSGTIYAVVFLILDASFIINQVGPFLQTIAMASAAGQKVFALIQRPASCIDPYSADGATLQSSHGTTVEIRDVSFFYPARPETKVLDSVSLNFPAGSSTGIVGHSGSGKSSLAGLFLRLYDPVSGSIKIGGSNIQDLNTRSLRSAIALVDQEPTLFEGTILDNIRAGILDSDGLSPEAIRQRCEEAARDANATDFIDQLPDGLDTDLNSGNSLSGGQRQRICLARALVRCPSVLILDEPTSALDSTSEAKILDSVQRVCKTGCTVIMIAHRLATIQDMDNIVLLAKGKLVEQGTHQQLMEIGGAYQSLVDAQQVGCKISGSQTSNASTLTLLGGNQGDEAIEDEKAEYTAELPAHLPLVGQGTGGISGKDFESKEMRRGSTATTIGRETIAQHEHSPRRNEPSPRKEASSWKLICRVMKMSKPESPLLMLGLFGAGIMGTLVVFEAIVFGNLITILNHERESPNFQDRIDFFCLMFFIISLVAMSMSGLSNSCFGLVSEALLTRIRDTALRNALRQDQAFFQEPEHSPQRLIAAINSDSNFVAGLSGNIIATLFAVCFNIVSGLTVSLVFAWSIALVLMAVLPAIVVAGFCRVTLLTRYDKRHSDSFKHAAALASEAVQNIRTVAAYGRERDVLHRYRTAIGSPYRQNFWYCVFGDLALTLSYSIVFFTYALAYWWGSRQVRNGQFTERDFFTMLPAFLLTAQQSGQLFTAAPELVQARAAARRLFSLLDEQPTIMKAPALEGSRNFLAREKSGEADTNAIAPPTDSTHQPKSGDDVPTITEGAEITFVSVGLTYPKHPDKVVLEDVSLHVKRGQSVGIVGPSGAGKSSLISLLERFYDPTTGRVLINNTEIRGMPVDALRSGIALVSQEPTLFAGSIAFNVGLGASPSGPRPTQSDIERVCKSIGIHDFITSLPEGYATDCGSGGSQLSGGQKQRIAIARALIRNPALLILDEATSALDSHSERQVQDAIDAASRGRTTITVAHRLSTVKNADVLFCFDKGRFAEQGTHDQLVALGGIYAGMVKAQTLN